MSFRESIANETVERFLSDGFVAIKVSGLLHDKLEDIFKAGQVFFNENPADKLTNQLHLETGYRPMGLEYSTSPDHPDEMESFSVSRRINSIAANLTSKSAKILYVLMLDLLDFLVPLVEDFTTAAATRLTGTSFERKFEGAFDSWSILQINYSRPALVSAEYINDCHEDGNLMTVLCVTGPGLELQLPDGSFLPMSPTTDKLLFMSGEILHLLSGGRVRPTYHRVRSTPECHERMSLLFFADIHPKHCNPWISTESNHGVNIRERMLHNSARFGLTKWTDD